MSDINTLLHETRLFPPSAEWKATARVNDPEVYARAARDPEKFWADFAAELEWETPWKTVGDLVADLKKRPGEFTFSSSGLYGASHVPMAWFLQAAGGLQMKHLPTTGGGPAMTAVLGNHAQMWVSPTGVAAPHIKAGKVRALATLAGARHPRFPDVPTLKELGYDIEYYYWVGLFAPRSVPGPILKKLELVDTSRHAVVASAHPSPLSAKRGFFGSRPFSKINAALRDAGRDEIDWKLPDL